jgi:type I restriction enzyme S subunit
MAAKDWPVLPLGELTDNFDGRRVPVKELDRNPGPYPYYGASGIVDRVDGYLFDGEYLLIGEDGENLRTRQTPIAFLATGKFWVNNHAHIVRGNDRADTRFLSYALSQTDIGGFLTGSTMPKLTQGNLNRLPIIAPPLAEQKVIAAVLGALDDKIELNRRMNETLEEMAHAMFRSWFVEFDPVRTKLDGRNPVGIHPSMAALFPSSFQDSEVGHIPLGWKVCSLSDLTSYLSRGIGPVYIDNNGVCVLNQKCIREHRVDFSKSRRHDVTKKPIGSRTLQPHDVLINSTGVGTLGRVAQVFHLSEPTIVDSHITIARAGPEMDPYFFGVMLTDREMEIEQLGEGSTGQTELSRARLGALRLVKPPVVIQRAFGATVGPLLSAASHNDRQSRVLSTLRDALLPKLLSGELKVTTLPSGTEA